MPSQNTTKNQQMSSNPALAALGITAGLGTLLSVVFAPAALVLLQPTDGSR